MSALARSNAWLLTCESWMDQDMYIALPVNPGEISFSMPIRVTNESYRSTKIAYVWRDRGFRSVYDCPVINFTVPSGNILPSFNSDYIKGAQTLASSYVQNAKSLSPSEVRDGFTNDRVATEAIQRQLFEDYSHKVPPANKNRDPREGLYAQIQKRGRATTDTNQKRDNTPDLYRSDMPIGIQNAYAILALAEERRIRTVNDANQTRTDNRVVAVINTLIFPRLIIYGWFAEDGVKLEESADNLGEVLTTFSLVVTDTYPRLKYDQWATLNQYYFDRIGSPETSLEYARSQANSASRTRAQESITEDALTIENP